MNRLKRRINRLSGGAATVSAPTISSATIGSNGLTLTFVFSEAMTGTTGFTCNGSHTIAYSAGSGTNTYTLTIDQIYLGDTVTYSYTPGNLTSVATGLSLAAVSGGTIINESSATQQFVYDTFFDVNATAIASHVGEIGATWTNHGSYATGTAAIDTNRLKATNTNAGVWYASGSPPADGAFSVSVTLKVNNQNSLTTGICADIATGSNLGWGLIFNKFIGAAGGLALWSFANGNLLTYERAAVDGDVLTLIRHGTYSVTQYPGLVFRGLVNGVEVMRMSNGQFGNDAVAIGKVGLIFSETSAGAEHFDTFTAKALTRKAVIDGDSLSTATDSIDNGYAEQMIASLGAEWYDENYGVAGQHLSDCVADFASQIAPTYDYKKHFNILCIWAGTNDIQSGDSAATVYAAMQTYCAAARAAGFKVFCASMMTRSDVTVGNGREAVRLAYNALMTAGASGFSDGYVDIDTNPHLTNNADGTYFHADGIHLIAAGYAQVAAMFKTVINAAGIS